MMSIAILTFCVGADYKKAMEPGLNSKREYAKKHGYSLHIGGEDVWDRKRPIPWSKIQFILKYIDQYDYVFWSDADVIILNQEKTIEANILPLLPKDKHLLWTYDACNHYNNGNMLLRGKTEWTKDFLKRSYEQTDVLYHIWWDNAAMLKLWETNPSDKERIETCKEHWIFNSYAFGPNNSAKDPTARLYTHGDFLLHFAGVYEPWNIYRMMKYVQNQCHKKTQPSIEILDSWRNQPPKDKQSADSSLSNIQ